MIFFRACIFTSPSGRRAVRPRPPRNISALQIDSSAMASRSRTREFIAQRERLRGNRRSHKAIELKDMKVDRSLLKQPGMSDDDASSCENACSITVPPLWVAVVDELNRDMGSIRTKRTRTRQPRAHVFGGLRPRAHPSRCWHPLTLATPARSVLPSL